MAPPYAYQVLCRIEFTDGRAKPRWYTIGQYDDRGRAEDRAESFCNYLRVMRAEEPPRTKPHSLRAVFEIRGPRGAWTQCRQVVPKGVDIFRLMRNDRGRAAHVAKPRRRAAPAVVRGTFAVKGYFVELEGKRGAGPKKAYAVAASATERQAISTARKALVLAIESNATRPGDRYRTLVRNEKGKVVARTEWVAA